MNSFSFAMTTEVIFGKDALDGLNGALKKNNANKVLVLYGSGSVVKNGVLGKVTAQLDSGNIDYITLGGVQPNPILSFVYSTTELCVKEGVDFILAVGGGSVLDTAKAVGHAVANPNDDVWDFFLKKKNSPACLPVGSVLTISAAGSETSNSAVITNTEFNHKRGLTTELNRPKFAILNPEFTFTLPKYQVACGVVDIMMHTLDRYLSRDYDNEITNQLAEGVLRTAMMFGNTAVDNPTDYKAMSELMWCGSLSHNGLTGLGNVTDFSPHQLGHSLSAIYDAAHGATLSVCWGAFAEYVYKKDVTRFARYARNVVGVVGTDDEAVALEGIQKTKAFFASLGMPLTITELLGKTLTEEQVLELALDCSFDKTRTIGSMVALDHDDILAIFKSVL